MPEPKCTCPTVKIGMLDIVVALDPACPRHPRGWQDTEPKLKNYTGEPDGDPPEIVQARKELECEQQHIETPKTPSV